MAQGPEVFIKNESVKVEIINHDETSMNFGVLNSQKSMNKIYREFHSANNLYNFYSDEKNLINTSFHVFI